MHNPSKFDLIKTPKEGEAPTTAQNLSGMWTSVDGTLAARVTAALVEPARTCRLMLCPSAGGSASSD